jgi:hypothetical protein
MSRAWRVAAFCILRSSFSALRPFATRLRFTTHSSAERSLAGAALDARADAPEQAAAGSADAAPSASRHAKSAVAAECDRRFDWTLRSNVEPPKVTP